MLSKPFAGWSTLTIGEKKIQTSYLTDVPLDILETIKEVLNIRNNVCVTVDAEEDGEYVIIFGTYTSFIIEETAEGYKLYSVNLNIKTLAEEIIFDIESYFDDWLTWNPSLSECDMDSEEKELYQKEISERKHKFNELISEIKSFLQF